jgi:hypothetical protein
MSLTSTCDRSAARPGNPIPGTASRHPPGSNVIAFQPIKAPSRLHKIHDHYSAAASAQIVPLNTRRRLHLTGPALRSASDASTNEDTSTTRNDYNRRMWQNILAIGWVGTLMAVAYCVLTIPMF